MVAETKIAESAHSTGSVDTGATVSSTTTMSSAVEASDELEVAVVSGAEELRPKNNHHKETIRVRSTTSTAARRTQYTVAGSGPIGFRKVLMPPRY